MSGKKQQSEGIPLLQTRLLPDAPSAERLKLVTTGATDSTGSGSNSAFTEVRVSLTERCLVHHKTAPVSQEMGGLQRATSR